MIDLPALIVLTDRRQCEARGRTLVETVKQAADGGARAVLVREKDLPYDERRQLVASICEIMGPIDGVVGVASDIGLADGAGLDWVHLAQRDGAVPGVVQCLGRSCHDIGEARRACTDGCAYIMMSPVALTVSKPGYGPALGADGLRAACEAVAPMPVWALGGITPDNADTWFGVGVRGIAVMGAMMRADEPAEMAARYLIGVRR